MSLLHVPYVPVEFPHAQRITVAKHFEAAFLFASAYNRYLSSTRGTKGLFFPPFKEFTKMTSHCFPTWFLTLRLPHTNNDTCLNVGKLEANGSVPARYHVA
jgi:hypothetical protein